MWGEEFVVGEGVGFGDGVDWCWLDGGCWWLGVDINVGCVDVERMSGWMGVVWICENWGNGGVFGVEVGGVK